MLVIWVGFPFALVVSVTRNNNLLRYCLGDQRVNASRVA